MKNLSEYIVEAQISEFAFAADNIIMGGLENWLQEAIKKGFSNFTIDKENVASDMKGVTLKWNDCKDFVVPVLEKMLPKIQKRYKNEVAFKIKNRDGSKNFRINPMCVITGNHYYDNMHDKKAIDSFVKSEVYNDACNAWDQYWGDDKLGVGGQGKFEEPEKLAKYINNIAAFFVQHNLPTDYEAEVPNYGNMKYDLYIRNGAALDIMFGGMTYKVKK